MNKNKNTRLTPVSQKLRRSMTKEERHLWYDFLKKLPQTFHRQKVIGRYIVDFYCAAARLVVELDGSQHYEQSKKAQDASRDAYLKGQGLTVLRYSNLEILKSFDAVCADILLHLDLSSVSLRLPPSPQGEG